MKKRDWKCFLIAACFLAGFGLWTALVRFVDVRQIGPENSCVGLSQINGFVHNGIGIHMVWYTITDFLEWIPFGVIVFFGLAGLAQWIKRKHIMRVDGNILLLGAFYVVVLTFFLLFEVCVVNYRPVLIDGVLEASYPSSTTLITLCVMPTAWLQVQKRIKNRMLNRICFTSISFFTAFMVMGRLISGVHWFSDIVGSCLLSVGLVTLYYTLMKIIVEKQ